MCVDVYTYMYVKDNFLKNTDLVAILHWVL